MRLVFCLLVLFLGLFPGVALSQTTEAGIEFTDPPQEWVIVMHDPRSNRRRSRIGGVGYSAGPSYDGDPRLKRAARRLAADFKLKIVTEWPIKSLNVHCVVATLPADQAVADFIDQLKADPRVASVQQMNAFESSGTIDPYRKLQLGLDKLGVTDVHSFATGAGVSVSIIDSGVDATHPDLDGVVVLQENFVDSAAMPAEQHGTGVAGVIAARTNNGVGVAGVAPDADVQALRACWQNDESSAKAHCNTLTLSRALDRVIEIKPRLLNLSLTGPYDPLLEQLLTIVLEQDTIVVAAFDEARGTGKRFPMAQRGVFYARNAELTADSRLRDCLPAPGTDVLTLQPSNQYDVLNGNSLSAAHVSGVIALLLEHYPALTVGRLADVLNASIERQEGAATISACRAFQVLDSQLVCTSTVVEAGAF